MTSNQAPSADSRRKWRIVLRGEVQGIGVRPTIARLATARGWHGWVRNLAEGVEVVVEVPASETADEVLGAIFNALGTAIEATIGEAEFVSVGKFLIESSEASGRVAARVPRDKATCPACWSEVNDPADRRFGYPLSACVECGPRYSVVRSMPYDRVRTTLDGFPLCDECLREYADPQDRRFHAQAIACPSCGPSVWCTDRLGRRLATGQKAIDAAIAALRLSQIVALRGVGGYQFLCDATSAGAVGALRQRKSRPIKPFAVLCHDLDAASRLAVISDLERKTLLSPSNPIVLVKRKSDARLAPTVCWASDSIGILLPTTPLHRMIAEAIEDPLVCTSGNPDGEPLVVQCDAAERNLAGIADLFLHHNRDIARPIDDSVVRVIKKTVTTLRCARGLAPLPLPIEPTRPLIATGGHLKGAIALANGTQAVLGPHIGDLDTESTRERWTEHVSSLCNLYRVENPEWICDEHPDYFSTDWVTARQFPVRRVWHHHAHIAAGQLEHQLLDQRVIGVAFDGTGLGPDKTIWGGEFLVVEREQFSRFAHLRPFALIGGEAAIHDVRRLAAAVAFQVASVSLRELSELLRLPQEELSRWKHVAARPSTPWTTSCGRLFDAIAALSLGLSSVCYDGHAAACVEAAFDESSEGQYDFRMTGTPAGEVDWRPVIEAVIRDCRRGANPGVVSARFHRGLASAVFETCRRQPGLPVVLSGGVFQNRRLVEEIVARWPNDRTPPVWPSCIPCNDGGLAAGQLAIAAMSLRD